MVMLLSVDQKVVCLSHAFCKEVSDSFKPKGMGIGNMALPMCVEYMTNCPLMTSFLEIPTLVQSNERENV